MPLAGYPGVLDAWREQFGHGSHDVQSTNEFASNLSRSTKLGMLTRETVQWPSGFDQPYVANELDRLGVARELLQIRDGELLPLQDLGM